MLYACFVRAALLCLLAIPGPAAAQQIGSQWSLQNASSTPWSLTLSGSLRTRYETLAGQPRTGISANDDLISLRTTLFAEYDSGWMRLGGELYDSRAYGGDDEGAVSTSDVNALELVQAYAAFDLPEWIGIKASVQAGRFILDLGSRRLVGADEYRNTINAYTGLRADLSMRSGVSATLIYTLPHINLPDDKQSVLDNAIAFDRESFDLVLWGGIVNKTEIVRDASLDVTYLHLDERDAPARPTRNRSLDTLGVRRILQPRPGQFDYEAEGIYQFGTIRDGLADDAAELDVSAWFAHVDVGYSHESAWNPRISIETDYASGDGRGRHFNRFDTLFGMRRADLAPAGIYAALGRTNVFTPAIRLEAAPGRLDWFAAYRLLWLASPTDAFSTTGVRDPTGQSGAFAGQQIEGRIRYWFIPDVLRFEMDAVVLVKERFLKTAPNAPATGNTRYMSFNLTAYF